MSDDVKPATAKILKFKDVETVDDTTYDTIPVPQWGGSLSVGTLSAADLLEFVEANEDPIKKKSAGVRLLVKSLVDENKKRLATDDKTLEEGIAIFIKKDANVITDVVKKLMALNKLDKKGQEAIKNASGEAPSGASPSN